MTAKDGKVWLDALSRYAYAVDFARFTCGFGLDWINIESRPGTRAQTILLENHFRAKARTTLEAWYAVVFWKMYSQGKGRGRAYIRTVAAVQRINSQNHQASDLWTACSNFVIDGNRDTFQVFQRMIISRANLPIVATFPAFMAPERFPMVDSWIARWVNRYLNIYPENFGIGDSQLIGTNSPNSITIYNWGFYDGWVKWCREAARVLTICTRQHWRARDVEMAAFQNANEEVPLPLVC